jgi:hypothetical protein
VVFAGIDFASGLLASDGFRESFVAGTEPAQPYDAKWGLILSLPWYQQQPFYLPKRGERMPAAQSAATDEDEPDEADTGEG